MFKLGSGVIWRIPVQHGATASLGRPLSKSMIVSTKVHALDYAGLLP